MKPLFFLLLAFLITPGAIAADQPAGPHIVGAAGIAYDVTDLGKARVFYEDLLGFREAFTLRNPDGSDHAAYVKINDHQYIELIVEKPTNHGFLHGIAFQTDDAKGMRAQLAAKGIKVPDTVGKNPAGDLEFDVIDPSGFTIEIVQYLPHSRTGRDKGKGMSDSRISTHIDHLGLLVNSRDESWKFYSDAFGFVKEGDGSKMTIPGSSDRFELGFERKPPVEARFHIKDHICLSNPDVPKMTAELQAKPEIKEFPKAIADTHQLGSGKNVVEIYDLDGNRVEVMEPPKAE